MGNNEMIQFLIQLIEIEKKNPNDMDLGKKVRILIKTINKTESNGIQ
jgi:hypothetical protein